VEDQSADSSDLNADADAAAASVPQGKAGRNRHRLPRQKAPQVQADGVEEATETTEATEATEAPEVPAEETVSAEAEPAEEAVEADEVVLVPHRTAGRALKLVAVAAGVLFVAACAFAGATIQPYLADRAAVHTKFVIAETAANAITTLWTYTPDDMDKLPDRSAKYLGGDFAADYKRYIDAIVAPNKQAQVTNNTQVLGAAVESLTPTEATAIVYTNSVATSPVTKGIPSLRYLSYRLTMKPQDNRWLITQMVAVTKLDLTPRL
jgi:Mce-associated membrane protein